MTNKTSYSNNLVRFIDKYIWVLLCLEILTAYITRFFFEDGTIYQKLFSMLLLLIALFIPRLMLYFFLWFCYKCSIRYRINQSLNSLITYTLFVLTFIATIVGFIPFFTQYENSYSFIYLIIGVSLLSGVARFHTKKRTTMQQKQEKTTNS